MNRILTIIFVFLLLFIAAEIGFLLILNKQSKNNQSQIKQAIISEYQAEKNQNLITNLKNNNQLVNYNSPYIHIDRLAKIEGIVISWEDVSNSSDKYLNFKEEKTGKIYKTRVVFDKKKAKSLSEVSTGFGKKREKEEIFDILGPISNYNFEEINSILKNKKLTIKPAYSDPNERNFYKDENNVMIARWLIYNID